MNRLYQRFALMGLALFLTATAVQAQHEHTKDASMANCPMHDKHMADLKDQGGRAMGFDQDKTTHHFRLTSEGGAIEVEANDAADAASRDQIRSHLASITQFFADGDFSKPFAVHGQIPPGVDGLTKLKAAISYRFEETKKGGRVLISTRDNEALSAIHDFLRFQITDHRTGDPLEVTN